MDPSAGDDPFRPQPLRRRTTKVIRVTEDGRVVSSKPVAQVFADTRDDLQRFEDRYRKGGEGR